MFFSFFLLFLCHSVSHERVDSLDAFMSSVGTQLDSSKRMEIKLQLHHLRKVWMVVTLLGYTCSLPLQSIADTLSTVLDRYDNDTTCVML